jgi:nucleotide-binding universal stress UspA family protein
MKSVLLHVYEDGALDARLQVALDFCRAHDAHLTCLHVTPYNAYVAFDPLGGAFTQGAVMDELRKREEDQRAKFEAHMAHEDVRWDWAAIDGDVVQLLTAWSAVADLVIVSQSVRGGHDKFAPLPIVDDLVVHAECPVLVVPAGVSSYATGPVVVGWNASPEAANAIRHSLPVLKAAPSVQIVTVGDDSPTFPQTAASTYLARHGVTSELTTLAADGRKPSEVIISFAKDCGASLIIMGAYGRSRFRETLLGGVTRNLLGHADIPLMLGR